MFRILTDLLNSIADKEPPIDLHEAVSFPLPVQVICEWLGVPYADRKDFRCWCDDSGHRFDAARSQAGLKRLQEYMRALLDNKRAEPAEDVLSELATAATASEFTADHIALISAGLLSRVT